MTAASPEPNDGTWAAPAASGASPAAGDGTRPPADAAPPTSGPVTPGSEEGQPAGPPAFAAAGYHPGGAEASSYGGAAAGAVVPGETSAVGGPWSAPVGWRPQAPAEPRIPTKRRFGAAVLTAAVVAVVGAPLGWLWSVVAPGVPIIKTDDGAVFATPSPEQFIASDGWFTILLFGLGLVSALVTWVWFKRYRGPWTLAGLLVGTVGASILAWEIGRRIGLDAFHDAVAKAQSGDLIVRPPDLRAGGFTKLWDVIPFVHGDLLMATFGAVIVYTLLAGWSRTPSLRPEPEPQPQPAVNPFYELHGPTPPPATQAGPGESAS